MFVETFINPLLVLPQAILLIKLPILSAPNRKATPLSSDIVAELTASGLTVIVVKAELAQRKKLFGGTKASLVQDFIKTSAVALVLRFTSR